jgi:hypothetical protein
MNCGQPGLDKPSRLLADLDRVSFQVANFEELRVSAILDRPNRAASAVKILVSLLQMSAKNDGAAVGTLIPGSLNFAAVAS